MEDVLHQYQLPYDPQYPLICFDERPCFLIEEVGALLPMSPGKAKRYHYEYKKNGSCCVFLAFEVVFIYFIFPETAKRSIEELVASADPLGVRLALEVIPNEFVFHPRGG